MIVLGRGLGLSVEPLTRELARTRRVDLEEGVLVTQIELNGPAQQAGIGRGDVIVHFGRHRLHGVRDLLIAIREVQPESTVDLVLARGGRSVAARIVLSHSTPISKRPGAMDANRMRMGHAHELRRAQDAGR